jgi:hypothetical protein
LRAFGSEAEMAAYHRELVEAILSKPPLGAAQTDPSYSTPPSSPADSAPAPAAPRIFGDPLIRAHGQHLVVLREGRLSTIRIAGGALEREQAVDALGPGEELDGMLFYALEDADAGAGVRVLAARTSGDTSESHVAAFRVGADGRLERDGGTVLRSAGGLYGGAHATRRLDDRVVFYDRIDIPLRDPDPTAALPMLRGADGRLATTVDPRRVYPAVTPMSWPDQPRLHVVTICADAEPACAATALYAPEPAAVHLSANAVYLWTRHAYAAGAADEEGPEIETLYRMPLDGSAPSALQVSGSTFSADAFLESADGYLNVHFLHGGWTEEAWSQLPTPTLLRVPLSAFGDGRRAPQQRHYRPLRRLGGPFISRYAGDWLVYGNRAHDGYRVGAGPIAPTRDEGLGIGMLRWADTAAPAWLPLQRPTQAFAALGDGGVLALVGGGDSTVLAYLPLGPSARMAAMAAPRVEQWEGALRGVVAHPGNTAESGLLAIVTGIHPTPYRWVSTGVAFVRYDAAGMRQVGELSRSSEPAGDREVVPVFADGRIFVLLGGELVEVEEKDGGVRELRRIPLP